MTRQRVVFGNWKLNGTRAEVDAWAACADEAAAAAADSVLVGVAPPAVWIERVAARVGAARVAAQNISEHARGAHTGELGAAMALEAGADWTLVGHSERRQLYGESDATVAAKVSAAFRAGLGVVLCVGETLEERERDATWAVVRRQIDLALPSPPPSLDRIAIAYEPVWAIGTGRTATPEQAQDVHSQIRGWLRARDMRAAAQVRVIYGGSVNADNATELFACEDVDGALVGGASLDPAQFAAICATAAAAR